MNYRLLTILALPVLLSGCVAAAVGAGTETGIALAEERSVGNKVDDAVIYTDINNRLAQAGNNLFVKVTVRVRHQRVMLTGIVPTQDLAQRAVSIAWTAKGVTEVINEIIISPTDTFMNTANDTLIKKNLEARLLLTKDVWVINYSIDVVNSTAYLLGRVYDRAELNRVMNVARTTKGIKRVVNHLQVRSEMAPEIAAPGTGAAPDTAAPYQPASVYTSPSTGYSAPIATPTEGTIGIDSVTSTPLPPAGGGY